MYKKIIIYDGHWPSADGREFMKFDLEPLLTNLRKMWDKTDYPKQYLDELFQCPAFAQSLKNTFVYKCPYDLSVKYDEGKRYTIELPTYVLKDDHSEKRISKDGKENNHDIQLFNAHGNRFLFASQSCEVTQEQPYFHNKDLTMLSGSFNIGKWFRPMHPAVLNFGQKDFNIKRGEALQYIKFPKDAKIEIRRTLIDKDLFTLAMGCGGYKNFVPKQKLEQLYKYFTATVNKKKLLKKLEQNRID